MRCRRMCRTGTCRRCFASDVREPFAGWRSTTFCSLRKGKKGKPVREIVCICVPRVATSLSRRKIDACDSCGMKPGKRIVGRARSSTPDEGRISVTHPPLPQGLPHETKCYVCIDVFGGIRPVLYVARPDGDWCALCGDEHPDDASGYRVVGIGHVIDSDPSVSEVLDLGPNEEAERSAVGEQWARSSF